MGIRSARYPGKVWARGEYRDELLLCLDRERWLSLFSHS